MKFNTITRHWLWMIPVLLIVAGLATRQIDRFPISIDELLSMNNAGYFGGDASPLAVLDNLSEYSQQHVPVYFVVLGLMSEILGWTPPALRMIGVWFGLLALAWVYRLGRDHFDGSAGLYGALFVAGMTLYSFYYAHIRMYPLLVMGSAMVLWFYMRAINPAKTIRWHYWVGLSLSTLLFLSTHIFSITLMACIGLYHLLVVPKNRRWWIASGVIGIGGLPLIGWLPVLLRGFQHTSTFSIVTENALTPSEIFVDMLIVYSNSIIPFLLIWSALTVYIAWRRDKSLLHWLGLAGGTGLIILLIGGLTPIIPPDRLRYTLVMLVPLAIAFGGLLVQFRYHILIAGFVIGVWFGTDLYMHRQHDMSRYLGGRMNIYDMPRIDENVPLIKPATDSETLLLTFSNHRDLTLPVRHGNTVQDFYYDSINREHYSVFLPQEILKENDEIAEGIVDALEGWSWVAWIDEVGHTPPRRILRTYQRALTDFTACEPLSLSSDLTVTVYVLDPDTC